MAKNIERLNAGQTPSLLQASKGNELIDAINYLRASKSSADADGSGISLKVTSEGVIELDVSQATANVLAPAQETGQLLPTGFVEQRFNATVNGVAKGIILLIKTD